MNNVIYTFQITSPDSIFLARHVALKSGIPLDRPALAVNRLCGTGFQSVVNGAQVSIRTFNSAYDFKATSICLIAPSFQ